MEEPRLPDGMEDRSLSADIGRTENWVLLIST